VIMGYNDGSFYVSGKVLSLRCGSKVLFDDVTRHFAGRRAGWTGPNAPRASRTCLKLMTADPPQARHRGPPRKVGVCDRISSPSNPVPLSSTR